MTGRPFQQRAMTGPLESTAGNDGTAETTAGNGGMARITAGNDGSAKPTAGNSGTACTKAGNGGSAKYTVCNGGSGRMYFPRLIDVALGSIGDSGVVCMATLPRQRVSLPLAMGDS
jgi:hypothetical protein